MQGDIFLRKGCSSIYEKILVRKMPRSAYKAKYLETLKKAGQSKAPMPLFETLHIELEQREECKALYCTSQGKAIWGNYGRRKNQMLVIPLTGMTKSNVLLGPK